MESDPPDREQKDNAEHQGILAALAHNDPANAERLMKEHIDRSRQTLMEFLARRETAS